jgi:hypothetical protein
MQVTDFRNVFVGKPQGRSQSRERPRSTLARRSNESVKAVTNPSLRLEVRANECSGIVAIPCMHVGPSLRFTHETLMRKITAKTAFFCHSREGATVRNGT